MPDDVLKFKDFRERDENQGGRVRCARCGRRIPATSNQCPECKVYFRGEAQDFYHPSELAYGPDRTRRWMIVVAVMLVGALILGALVAR